jgi:UDP-N-acetylglucosamine 2-epimerase (non-hydrolysing)
MTALSRKIVTVVGARPQFIKLAALSPEIRKYFTEVIVHTGQHYDTQLSDVFFNELNIPEPDYRLGVGSGLPGWQIARMLEEIEKILLKEKPAAVIVFGDTNSTAAAAIAAAKCNIPLAHVEAGLREFDKKIPEETNKLITDILCDYYFCPSQTAVDTLKDMGITQNVFLCGDVMIDIMYQFADRFKEIPHQVKNIIEEKRNYLLLTFHRKNNILSPEAITQILEAASNSGYPVIFPVHPATRQKIEEFSLDHLLELPGIFPCAPCTYIETQQLIHHAECVLTDSGGITKEAYYQGVRCILLDKQTEWVETLREGWNSVCGPDKNRILYQLFHPPKAQERSFFLGNGDASAKIAKILNDCLPE